MRQVAPTGTRLSLEVAARMVRNSGVSVTCTAEAMDQVQHARDEAQAPVGDFVSRPSRPGGGCLSEKREHRLLQDVQGDPESWQELRRRGRDSMLHPSSKRDLGGVSVRSRLFEAVRLIGAI